MKFSSKYHEQEFPERYALKHKAGISRRLNDAREKALLRKSLEGLGILESLADIGTGPGRFWPVLDKSSSDSWIALDVSYSMLNFARSNHRGSVQRLPECVAGSVLALPLATNAVDCVVSMRLLHHFGDDSERRQALSELARVARRFVVISLWVDGNYKAWRRKRLESRRTNRPYQNRHIVTREQLKADFAFAGLKLVRHFDLVPGYSQWRYYVLEKA